jgi:transcription-repair coupling factor (superfamily II helicase)
MFLKLMESTISELKGEAVYENIEPEINVKMSAFIPEAYISDIDQRLTAYRRLAKTLDIQELDDLESEMQDRYGKLPVETSNLFLKIMLKVLCVQAGVKKIDLHDHKLSICFSEVHQKNPLGIIDLIHEKKGRYQVTPEHVLKVTLAEKNTKGALAEIKNILKDITQHVNG